MLEYGIPLISFQMQNKVHDFQNSDWGPPWFAHDEAFAKP